MSLRQFKPKTIGRKKAREAAIVALQPDRQRMYSIEPELKNPPFDNEKGAGVAYALPYQNAHGRGDVRPRQIRWSAAIESRSPTSAGPATGAAMSTTGLSQGVDGESGGTAASAPRFVRSRSKRRHQARRSRWRCRVKLGPGLTGSGTITMCRAPTWRSEGWRRRTMPVMVKLSYVRLARLSGNTFVLLVHSA